MKITNVTAFAIKIPRDLAEARGTAGSPVPLQAGASDYRFATTYQTLYSTKIETVLIKIETDAGLIGWGEAEEGNVNRTAIHIANRQRHPAQVRQALHPDIKVALDAPWHRHYVVQRSISPRPKVGKTNGRNPRRCVIKEHVEERVGWCAHLVAKTGNS